MAKIHFHLSILILLFSINSYAKVEIFGCSGGSDLSDYCAPTPTGDEPTPGFEVTEDDQKAQVPVTTDPDEQPEPNPEDQLPPVSPNPPTTGTTMVCPSSYSDPVWCANGGSCIYTRTTTYSDTGGSTCSTTITNGAPSEYPNQYGVEPGSYSGNPVPKVQGCLAGYTLNAGVCTKNEDTPPCPPGYTLNVDTCFSDDPRPTVDDDRVDVGASEDGYEAIPDVDNGQEESIKINIPNPQTVEIGTTTDDGRPQQVTGQIGENGSTIKVQEQYVDGNGNTAVKTTTFTFDSNGNHVGTSVTSNPGNLQGGGTNGTYTPNQGEGVVFPNDYAKSGDAQAAADSTNDKLDDTNDKLDQIHKDLTEKEGAPDDDGIVPEFETDLDESMDGLLSWNLPAHSSNCPTGSFTVWGYTFVLDAQCTIIEQQRPVISIAAITSWLVFALFIVLGA